MKYIVTATIVAVVSYAFVVFWSVILASKDDWPPGQEYPRPFDDRDDED